MSSIYDDMASNRADQLDRVSAVKQESLIATAVAKKQTLDPSYREFNPDLWEVIDNDTLRHRSEVDINGRPITMRLGFAQDGYSYDAWETRKDETPEEKILREDRGGEYRSKGRDPYKDNPGRASAHRHAYARQFGKDYKDVTNDDLYDAGLAQKQRLIEGMESLRGKSYDFVKGEDKYNRVLGNFHDTKAFDGISGGAQAGQYTKYNYAKQIEENQKGLHRTADKRSVGRALTGDAVASIFSGGANATNSLAQFTFILNATKLGVSPDKNVMEFFHNNEGRIKRASDYLSSDDKVQREMFDAKEQEFLSPLFQARVNEYKKMDSALEDWQATFLATKDEYADRLEYLGENPGRILDASFESLPYMLGVGAVGRIAAKKAGEAASRGLASRLVAGGSHTAESASGAAAKWLGSKAGKAVIDKAANRAGIVAIAGTEGAMNSASVYGQISSMSEEQLSQSEEYVKLRSRMSHQEAADKMALSAFNKTFYWNFALAGIASKVSGAGGWEASLLRGMGIASKRGLLKSAGKTTGDATIAGAREFVEESAQSGGGELISQIQSEEATGKAVGAGIGSATAEGGVTGLASGAGLSGAAGLTKDAIRGAKAGSKALSKSNTRHVEAATGVQTRADGDAVYGGSAAATRTEIERGKKDGSYDSTTADKAVTAILDAADADATANQEGSKKRPSLRQVNVLNQHFDELKSPSDETKRRVKQYRAEYKTALKHELDGVVAKIASGKLTPEAIEKDPAIKALLVEAEMVLKDGSQVTETGSPAMDGFLSSAKSVSSQLDGVEKLAAANSIHAEDKKTIDSVNEQKLGTGTYVVNGKTVLGLRAHAASITEAITTGNEAGYKIADGKLRNFLNSQTTKLRAYNELLTAVRNKEDKRTQKQIETDVSAKYGTKVEYKEHNQDTNSGTATLIKVMATELAEMGKIRKSLGEMAANSLSGISAPASRNAIQAPASGKLTIDDMLKIAEEAKVDVERSETDLEETLSKEETEGADTGSEAKVSAEEISDADKVSEPAGKEAKPDEAAKPTPTSETESAGGTIPVSPESKDEGSTGTEPKAEVQVEPKDDSVGIDNTITIAYYDGDVTYTLAEAKARLVEAEQERADSLEDGTDPELETEIRDLDKAIDDLVERQVDDSQLRLAEGDPSDSELAREGEQVFPENAGANVEEAPPIFEDEGYEYTDKDIENRTDADHDYHADGGASVDSLLGLTDTENDTDAGVDEEDAADGDPVASEDTSPPAPTVLTEVLSDVVLAAYNKAHYQLTRILNSTGLDVSQLRVDDDDVQAMLKSEINRNGGNINAAAQTVINFIIKKVGPQNDITKPPGDRAPTAQEDALIEAAAVLEGGGKLKPTIMVSLKKSVNFLSAKITPYIAPLVNEWGNPTIAWTSKKLAKTRALLKIKFDKLGLPTHLWSATQNANPRTKNLLAAVPNVMATLQKMSSRISFFQVVQATDVEKQGMNGVITFTTEFMNALDELHLGLIEDLSDPNSIFKRENINADRTAISNPLQESLFQMLLQPGVDLNGQDASIVSEQIAAIMAIEAGSWIASAGASTLNNRESTMNQFLGNADTDTVSATTKAVLGNGTLHTTVARQLGAKVVKEMNFKLNGKVEVSAAFRDTLEVSIGNMITATLAKMEMVEITEATAEFVKRNQAEGNSYGEGSMNLIYTKPKNSKATNGDQYIESQKNEQLRTDFQSAARILKDFFSVLEYRRGPSLKPTTAATTINGSLSKVPESQQRSMQKNGDIAHRPVKTMLDEVDRWPEERFLEDVMGSTSQEEIDNTVHTGDSTFVGADASAVSKNERNKRSLKQVRDWIAQNGMKPFYYSYMMISSHRIMIDSNTINAQADKLHRFLFGMKEWDVVMKSTSLNPKKFVTEGRTGTMSLWEQGTQELTPQYLQLRAFKVSVALALDIDTEGQSTDSIVKAFDERISEDTFKMAIEAMANNPDKYNELEMQLIAAAIKEGGEAAHTLAGLRAWADFIRAGRQGKRTVRVSIPMEIDGKTNGYAALLMQFAPRSPEELKELEPFYNAVGIFFKDGAFESYPDYIQNGGGQDNYNGVTEVSAKNVDNMRDGDIPFTKKEALFLTEEEKDILTNLRENGEWTTTVTESGQEYLGYKDQKAAFLKNNRDFQRSDGVLAVLASGFVELNRAFAKGPLTQVAYSASMASVRRALRKSAVVNFYTELAKAGHGLDNIVDVRLAIADVLVRRRAVSEAYATKSDPDTGAFHDDAMETLNEIPTIQGLINYRRTYVLSDTNKHNFEGGIDLVYGHSLQAALEERLEVIYAMTGDMTDSVYMANLIFTTDFKRRIAHREKTEGTLVDSQRKEILNQMVREGLVPMVDTALSQSQLDRLETTSTGQVALEGELKGRAYFDGEHQIHERQFDGDGNPLTDENGDEIRPGKQSSSVSLLTGITPNMNIGVASIAMATHSSDGSVNGDVMGKFPILNLFDASFGNFETIAEVGEYANQRFYEHHRNWNMGQAFYESLERMLPLIAQDDSRLSKDAKIEIFAAFQKQRQSFSGAASYDETAYDHWVEWLDSFRSGVNKNNEAREALFGEISTTNQFAKEDTIYSVPDNDTGAVNPKTASIVSETSWATGLLDIIRGDEISVASRKKRELIRELQKQLRQNGNTREVLKKWMDYTGGIANAPAAEDMLDVLYAVFADRGDAEQLAEIINTIRPILTRKDAKTGKNRVTRVILGKAKNMINPAGQEDEGRYWPERGYVEISDEANDIVAVILHEIIHAANLKQIEHLARDEDTRLFDGMLQDARDWANANLNAGRKERKAAMSIGAALTSSPNAKELANVKAQGEEALAQFMADFKIRQEATAISEYTAHLNSELSWTDGKFKFHFYSKADTDKAAQALASSVQTRKGNKTYYSSSEEIDDSTFSEEHGTQLTKDNLTSILQKLKQGDNVTPAVQQLFDHIVGGVLSQGLASIDSVIYKMATKKGGERNIGKYLVEADEGTVYVQATDQSFETNTLEMSQQEVAIHEILHAIFEWAINNNAATMRDIDKLFKRTLEALTEQHKGYDNVWKAFLPTGPDGKYLASNDPALDEQLAKERFEHVFGDPTVGKDYHDFIIAKDPAFPTDEEITEAKRALAQSGNQGKHEFMSMGLSNPQFIKILQGLDTAAPGPIWVKGEIIPSFMRLLVRAIDAMKGKIFANHKTTVSADLERLAKRVIVANTKMQERAKTTEDAGAISKRFEAMNNYAVTKLAGLVNEKMAKWAAENSHGSAELDTQVQDLRLAAKMLATGKSMTASVIRGNLKQFRDALDAAVVEKDHWMYEMLTEILPWADRNRSWVDMLRRSEVLIDGRRQQLIEHTRTGLHKFFAAGLEYTPALREAITNVILKTDLTALMYGDSKLTAQGVLDLIVNRTALIQRIEAFELQLESLAGSYYAEMFNKQSKGLASVMARGIVTEHMQQTNIYGIVAQRNIDKSLYKDLENSDAIVDVLEHLTTMRALALTEEGTATVVGEFMTKEMNRAIPEGDLNGFNGMMGMAQAFKDESFKKLFRSNPSQMIKGYVYEVMDSEIALDTAAYTTPQHRDTVIKQMKEKGFTWIEDLERDPLDNNPIKMMLFKQDRGVPTYSKSYMSLTGEQKRGTGILDSLFSGVDDSQPSNVTAARAYAMLARTTRDALKLAEGQFNPGTTASGVKMMPVYDENDNITDFRYIMSEATKKKHLKKRDYFDEVLPRMFASIEDRVNTKTINQEGIERLHEEWTADQQGIDPDAIKNLAAKIVESRRTIENLAALGNVVDADSELLQDLANDEAELDRLHSASEARYVAIGRNVNSPEGREMWSLLPKATRMAVEEIWGDELFYVRDDTVNLVLGFRKMSMGAAAAESKVFSPVSPIVRIAEKIWQEIIQWERFRIAVLNPVVVIGNVVSNVAMLLSQGITPQYIWRMTQEAIIGMRSYQKDLRARNELELAIKAAQGINKDTRAKEAELARLNANLNNNPVRELVEEGLFTSIVEEFGMDEDSTRRKLTTKLMGKVGGISGSKTVVKVAQEAMMVPGSELAQMALMATQYGDFVGRYIKFNWDTQVKGVARRTAIHESLDSFIYYNIPQNRILQALNDNGLMMFTKFFFRIQPIIGRTFTRNPVQASVTLGMQHMFDNRSAQENIWNYAFMSGGTRKFNLTFWDHVTNGDMFKITALQWIPDIFWKE